MNAYVNQVIVGLRGRCRRRRGSGWKPGWAAAVDRSTSVRRAIPQTFTWGRSITDSGANGTVDFSGTYFSDRQRKHARGWNCYQRRIGTGGRWRWRRPIPSMPAASIVGSDGSGNNVLTLGINNTILTNQLIIAQDYSNGTVVLPAGGTLNLGSAAQRANVFIANATTNTNNTYAGTLDVSNGIINAYLGTVKTGCKRSATW